FSIVYILESFPAITETFIYREIVGLRARGLNVSVVSTHPPRGTLSAEAQPLVDETFYLFPFSWLSLGLINIRFLFKYPARYLKTLSFVLTRPGERLVDRWRTFRHFLYGMFALRRIEALSPNHIHSHFGWGASTIALLASRILGIPWSLTLHSFYSKDAHPRHLLIEDKVRAARFIVTISEYHRQILIRMLAKEKIAHKIHVVPHGLDLRNFVPISSSIRENGTFTIAAVGQLIACKGFDVLV